MSQLLSSLRIARSVLKNQPKSIWNNASKQDVVVAHQIRHISGCAFASLVSTNSGITTMDLGLHQYNIRHCQPMNHYIAQHNMISTSTTLLNDDNDTDYNSLQTEQNVTIQTLGQLEESGAILPLQRSGNKKGKLTNERTHGFDDRAQAKLTALHNAKRMADDARGAYLSSTPTDMGGIPIEDLHEKWNISEQKLAHAYSQAVKYTSRIAKNETATKMAERLLYEWVDRFMKPFGDSAVWEVEDDDKDEVTGVASKMYVGKKWMVRSVNKVVPRLISSSSESNLQQDDGTEVLDAPSSTSFHEVRIPPPTSKDYINLLRAYSVSKARRKGQQSEALMKNMMRLANTLAHYYDEDNEDWSEDRVNDIGMVPVVNDHDGKVTKQWMAWVNESIPNSKVFSLAIKCHAGSTRSESFERIVTLNTIHDSFAECCQSHIPGMYKDDPYVLFHSIKALKNLQRKEEWDLGRLWLDRLHKFVTNPENVEYSLGYVKDHQQQPKDLDETTDDEEEEKPSQEGETPVVVYSQTIDVTAAYTSMIRLMAKLRGKKGVAQDTREILNRMHEVHDISVNGLVKDDEEPQTDLIDENNEENKPLVSIKKIAVVDIRSNAYNLVLRLYKDSKTEEDTTKAIDLLEQMIDAGKKAPEDRGGVPLPTEQSFEFAILSLVNMSDADKAFEEAERLIQTMQEQEYLDSTVDVYNAFITVCNRQLFGKAELYDKAINILNTMNEISKTNPKVSPSPETVALVMKACCLSEHDDHEKVLKTATDLFSQLKEQETDDKSAVALSERAYYNMMKCIDMHMIEGPDNVGAKQEMIEELFSEACQRGLCSADVLAFFRNAVSEEDYVLTVGKGRLADHWIANIRGPRALYTDGSSGGAGKHARRKGKSTSDYVKKQRVKDSQRDRRKADKKAKKFYKKLKAT